MSRTSDGVGVHLIGQSMRYYGPWRVRENLRGCGRASGVVSISDGLVRALERMLTGFYVVVSDKEIFRGPEEGRFGHE